MEHPNGEIKRTKNFLFFKTYPKVRKGSIVKVGTAKKKKPQNQGKNDKEKADWGNVLSNAVTQATAILSLILLVQNID